MSCNQDLLELSRHLKQERLFASAEKMHLANLSEEVSRSAQQLYHLSWISRQQRHNLEQMIRADQRATPEASCRRDAALENVNFVDGYKYLTYHESKIGDLLKHLRDDPLLLAMMLMEAEHEGTEVLQDLGRIVVCSLYGSGIMPEDEINLLQLLQHLIVLELAPSDNPRRKLRKGTCAFSIIFRLLNEGFFASKLFLTASLHKPVMQLLMEDEWFYDIAPDRALYRFPAQDRTRRFSQPGTEEYKEKTKEYRELTNTKLVMLTDRFICSIRNNMYCFPQGLAWLVSQLYQTICKSEQTDVGEVRAMCADLIFALFIGPAICDPEPYGILSDVPISYIARHNLMQVAQILQVLAISSWDEIDPKTQDLYGKFGKGCMQFLLDTLLETPCSERPPQPRQQHSINTAFQQASVFITMPELLQLISFARTFSESFPEDNEQRCNLQRYLQNIPTVAALQAIQTRNTPDTTPQPTPPGTPSTSKRSNKGKEKKRNLLAPEVTENNEQAGALCNFTPPDDVLVVSLGTMNDCPGMMSEDKVLEQDIKQRRLKCNSVLPGEDDPVRERDFHLHEKRTRFSLSHDQDSIATSDCLEAISEAASSHSVGSDLENENDNLSDFVSANVSGRGTPNISGRDTPLSQAESQSGLQEERQAPDLPELVQKNNREDVTDRFGKFDIKPDLDSLRDEAKSTVSDTWSTDVLASDSEPPETSQRERLDEIAEEMARQNLLGFGMGLQEVSEVSETASDVWSTDVLASDTSERQAERLAELDQDDLASISSRSQCLEDAEGENGPSLPAASVADAVEEAGDELGAVGGNDNVFLENSEMDPDTVSNMVDHFQRIDANKVQYRSNARVSASLKYSEGRVSDMLTQFDSVAQPVPVPAKSHSEESFKHLEGLAVDSVSSSLGGSAQTLVADSSLISPDLSALDGSISTLSPQTIEEDFKQPGLEFEDSFTHTPIDSDEISDGLKLTEQQNMHIDAQRLSSLCSFDPLLQESSTDTGNSAFHVPLPSNRSSNPLPQSSQTNIFQRLSYNGNGARPKTSNNDSSTPRIALKLNSMDMELNGTPPDSDVVGRPSKPLSLMSNGPLLPTVSDRESGSAAVLVDIDGASSGSDGGHDDDTVALRRCESTDSSTSSLTEVQTSLSKISMESTSQKSDELKESTGDADDKNTDKKKAVGFFRSFKERLSKGTNKRKVMKGPEKEDGVAASEGRNSQPIDIDRGGSGDAGSGGGVKSSSAPTDSQQDKLQEAGMLNRSQSEISSANHIETSDDILAKYRNKTPQKAVVAGGGDGSGDRRGSGVKEDEEETPPTYDPANLENCKAFRDAKKKLRLVLSTADMQTAPGLSAYTMSALSQPAGGDPKENEVVGFLKLLLAEAINLQDRHMVAQLYETIRCLRTFDQNEVKKLIKVMREEYRLRSPYISYLVRCRQGLLVVQAHMERLCHRVQRDKVICNKHFVSVYCRLFMEKKDQSLMKFISEFQRLTMADEKTDLVERFLGILHRHMDRDPVWLVASDAQVELARVYIERTVMGHIYTHAMYPNGDGDIMRDKILQEHNLKLSQTLTPSHRDLHIAKMYHYECPWPAAQSDLFMINAYKTPKDKLQCVLRCSTTIMNLLSMANDKGIPAADDFMPVLTFVIIKANPANILSTIQYVNSFYGKRLSGEEEYWWTQFVSSVEFIKTMIYRNS